MHKTAFNPNNMKSIAIIISLIFISIYSSGQEHRLLSFDLISKSIDTLNIPVFDTLVFNGKTTYNTGMLNDYYNHLNVEPPTENVLEGTLFTTKRQASKDYDINNYPIRTTVKLFKCENDSIMSKCSGSMISQKHVLTACHCVAKMDKDSLLYDSLFVCPVIDNGEFNHNFDCSWVKKIFFFEHWRMSVTDFAVLELEKPIGKNTGWISIGFDENDSSLLEGIYYKFSYPATTIPEFDPNTYNGDTLYYSYGIADNISAQNFGVKYANGIPGESGSSFIKVENESMYTSYGVLSFSNNLNHSRLNNWKYYALRSIIINDLELDTSTADNDLDISIFPNPTSGILNIICPVEYHLNKIALYDMMGKKVLEKNNLAQEVQLDLSVLPQGSYILMGRADNNKTIVKKVIRFGR